MSPQEWRITGNPKECMKATSSRWLGEDELLQDRGAADQPVAVAQVIGDQEPVGQADSLEDQPVVGQVEIRVDPALQENSWSYVDAGFVLAACSSASAPRWRGG